MAVSGLAELTPVQLLQGQSTSRRLARYVLRCVHANDKPQQFNVCNYQALFQLLV